MERSKSIDGLSINGCPVVLTCRSMGGLSCEVICEVQQGSLSTVAVLLVGVAAMLADCIRHQEAMVHCVATVSACVCFALFAKFSYYDVIRESVFVVKDFGVQLCTTYRSHRQVKTFVDKRHILDVMINEGITMNKVIFYLALLTSHQDTHQDSKLQLIPLLRTSNPRLATLKEAYHLIRSILVNENTS